MDGYGEFYWGNEGKKYFGFYKDDLKQGFGVYVWNFDPIEAYMGFWEKGKMAGLGVRVNGSKLKYGFWKGGKIEMWLQGAWELRKNAKGTQLKYLKIMEGNKNKIISYIQEHLIIE